MNIDTNTYISTASVGLGAGQIIYAIFAQYMYTRILLHPEALCHSGDDLWWKGCRVKRGLILCWGEGQELSE